MFSNSSTKLNGFDDNSHRFLIDQLHEDVSNYWTQTDVIDVIECPTSLAFLREYVSCYKPVIIRGLMNDMEQIWPAMNLWNENYLTSKLGNQQVKINLTRDGWADSVQQYDIENENMVETNSYFVYPAEAVMTMQNFFEMLNPIIPIADLQRLQLDREIYNNSNNNNNNNNANTNKTKQDYAIAYLSQQNDNIRLEMPQLLSDIPSSIPIANDAFNQTQPEAINLWIGDERSVSSLHKDHFENMYCVISGEKTFTLLPPSDMIHLHEDVYPTCKYLIKDHQLINNNDNNKHNNNNKILKSDLMLTTHDCPSSTISWIPLDPDDPDVLKKYPDFVNCHPIHCKLKQGDILYIPAMWYHRVSQTKLTIAVNYWYDQRFDF
eukprot:gene14938-20094_t